jgi:hypothetical protein
LETTPIKDSLAIKAAESVRVASYWKIYPAPVLTGFIHTYRYFELMEYSAQTVEALSSAEKGDGIKWNKGLT